MNLSIAGSVSVLAGQGDTIVLHVVEGSHAHAEVLLRVEEVERLIAYLRLVSYEVRSRGLPILTQEIAGEYRVDL